MCIYVCIYIILLYYYKKIYLLIKDKEILRKEELFKIIYKIIKVLNTRKTKEKRKTINKRKTTKRKEKKTIKKRTTIKKRKTINKRKTNYTEKKENQNVNNKRKVVPVSICM